ncbi:restriction endonuclease fold toxin [Streptomyces sp. NPDC058221]|uniref:restriction endonuclease fold toxin n=1 Tax=Streptomyces sp. NPDC058221 TaxID=3346388 RepID=UPI0036EC528B
MDDRSGRGRTDQDRPQGLTWTYEYDPAGHLVSERDFDSRTLTYAHDQAGGLTAHTDPLGQVTRYTHDALGRILTKDAAGQRTTFRWSPTGDLLRATSPGAALERTYDPAGRMTSETVNGLTLQLDYDASGNLVGRETPTGAVSTYTHDLAGQRTGLTASGRTVTHELDPAGRESRRSWNGVLSLTQRRDPAGRITTRSYATTVPLLNHTHTWRPDGHLTATDDTSYSLDATGRVTHVNADTWQESYAYDQAGNQTQAAWPEALPHSEATGVRTYTGTRIQTAGSIRYEHDAAGRTTLRQKTRLSRKPDTWHYTWDAEDRLVRVITPDGTAWRYTYDPLGRRTTKQRMASDDTVAEETVFTWQGNTLIEQTTASSDWPGRETLTWDHDTDGLTPLTQTTRYTPAAEATQPEVNARFYAIITDLIGTPTHLVDESGHIAWQAQATLWGTTTWNHDATAYIPLRFPGQYDDLETGHHYNLHRHYDPETARYLSPDPLGLRPAPNPSAYVHNPTTAVDPDGLAPRYVTTLSNQARKRHAEGKLGEAADIHYEDMVRARVGGTSMVIQGREIDVVNHNALIQVKRSLAAVNRPRNFLSQSTRKQIKATARISDEMGLEAEYWFKYGVHPDVRKYIEGKGVKVILGLGEH